MVAAAWIGPGLLLWAGARWAGALMVAFGVCWLLGDLDGAFVFLHRGPLVHLLLAYPAGRLGSLPTRLAVGAAYVDAVADPGTPLSTAVFGAALMLGTLVRCDRGSRRVAAKPGRARGGGRRDRRGVDRRRAGPERRPARVRTGPRSLRDRPLRRPAGAAVGGLRGDGADHRPGTATCGNRSRQARAGAGRPFARDRVPARRRAGRGRRSRPPGVGSARRLRSDGHTGGAGWPSARAVDPRPVGAARSGARGRRALGARGRGGKCPAPGADPCPAA